MHDARSATKSCGTTGTNPLAPSVMDRKRFSQHGQLEMHAVHGPALRGTRSQPRIVVGFLDQVLRCGTLTIKPYESIEGNSSALPSKSKQAPAVSVCLLP